MRYFVELPSVSFLDYNKLLFFFAEYSVYHFLNEKNTMYIIIPAPSSPSIFLLHCQFIMSFFILRYYYAVVECDSNATADYLYKACDGVEFERSSNVFDLRFIPDSMDFKHPPRDVATEVYFSTV